MKRENMYKLEVAEMTPREIDLCILSVNNMPFTKLLYIQSKKGKGQKSPKQ